MAERPEARVKDPTVFLNALRHYVRELKRDGKPDLNDTPQGIVKLIISEYDLEGYEAGELVRVFTEAIQTAPQGATAPYWSMYFIRIGNKVTFWPAPDPRSTHH